VKSVSEAPLILVADDEAHIVELVDLYLRRAGYRVEAAEDGYQALDKALTLQPALVVLDIMMPGPDGLQVCRTLRRRGPLPIVLLSARTSDVDKIAGLRFGADDYVTKPFNPDELVARIDGILRRAGAPPPQQEDEIRLGSLRLDLAARTASIEERPLPLPPREFDLLAVLVRFPGVALDREQLLDLAWGTSFYALRTVDVHVARLRSKLAATDSGVRIETVWGTGYRLLNGDNP
jgi:DNA-binding response OmpR family regulator